MEKQPTFLAQDVAVPINPAWCRYSTLCSFGQEYVGLYTHRMLSGQGSHLGRIVHPLQRNALILTCTSFVIAAAYLRGYEYGVMTMLITHGAIDLYYIVLYVLGSWFVGLFCLATDFILYSAS